MWITRITRFVPYESHDKLGANAHGLHLLEQQLGGVGQLDLRNLGLVLAALALEGVVAEVGDGDEAGKIPNQKLKTELFQFRRSIRVATSN